MFRRRDPAEKDPCDPGRTAESCRLRRAGRYLYGDRRCDGDPYSRNPFVRRNRQPSVRKYSAGRRLYHKSKRTEHPQQAGADSCSKSIKRFSGVSFPASGRGNDRGAGDTAEKPGRHLPPRGLGPRQYAGNRNTDFRGTGRNLCSARPWNQ